MVRIIGKAPEAYKTITCRNCASVLEYTQSEVQEYHGKDYSGGSDGQEWILCPDCGKKVIIRSW
jgi:RNase P subunit RPR2